MPKTEYIKSQIRASEIDEGDFISIGGQKFRVASTNLNDFAQVILTFSPNDRVNSDQTLIVDEWNMFTVLTEIPRRKRR